MLENLIIALEAKGKLIAAMARNHSSTDLSTIANDIIYWYGKGYDSNDQFALALCSEKYNELAEQLGWEKV